MTQVQAQTLYLVECPWCKGAGQFSPTLKLKWLPKLVEVICYCILDVGDDVDEVRVYIVEIKLDFFCQKSVTKVSQLADTSEHKGFCHVLCVGMSNVYNTFRTQRNSMQVLCVEVRVTTCITIC